jgi:cyanophycinase-like exopeptidase
MAGTSAALFLMAGGSALEHGRGPDPLVQEVFRRAGVQRPRVAYVGAASGDDAASRRFLTALLRRSGAAAVLPAPLSARAADAGKARAVMQGADLVFLSGGDVGEGMKALEERGVIPFLRALFRAGKPFMGISAGSIMLARKWVKWGDAGDEASAALFSCLGFARLLCDTHEEGEQWPELRAALGLSLPGTTGYGIVSGSALAVQDGSITALGGEVHVFRRRASGVAQLKSLPPGPAIFQQEVK